MPIPGPGLRERKKQQTRATIVREALRLFSDRGFEATTIADIADAAEIAPRTFFAYFPSKEAVVFHDFDEVFEAFVRRLSERADGETAIDALRAWIVDLVEAGELSDGNDARRRLVCDTPALEDHERSNMARFETALAAAVAEDLGVPEDALRAHLVAAAAAAALRALDRSGAESEPPSSADALRLIDEALVFLRGGVDALRRHPAV